MYGAIVPVRTRRPDATADIERIVLRALERDVTRRYQTMEAFSSDLRRAHRDVLAGAPTAVDTPAPVLTPPPLPPLPPLPPPAAQPAVGESGSTYTPLPAPSGSATPFTVAPDPRANRRGRRYGRRVRKGRSLWRTVGIVISIVFMVNWTRSWLFDPPRDVSSQRGAGDARPSRPNDIGQTIEDAVATGLLSDRLRVGRDPDGKREDLLEARPANEGSGIDEEGGGCVQRGDSARAEGRGR